MKQKLLIGLLLLVWDTGYGMRDTGYGMRDAGCAIRDAGYGMRDMGYGEDSTLALAWAGGINNVQFCALDLNLDGVSDLILFDRHGNRLIPLVYTGNAGYLGYHIDTSYVSCFPELHDWVMTADYDGDGRMDLFTYGLGSIRVFRNVSETSLQFEFITQMITSWYWSGYIGILVTPVDYPSIRDIDGDGDLDILTFFGLGSFVEYHQNLSQELYGTSDSLVYRLNTNCWGKFSESEGSNQITLNAECPGGADSQSQRSGDPASAGQPKANSQQPAANSQKHTGSTLLTLDLSHNGLPDLLLADVDYPNLIALFNEGSADTAFMTHFDTLFPTGTKPVELFDFPVVSCVDVDHDGLKDLLISSFNPSLTVANNHRSCWYYANEGTPLMPLFTFRSDQFFQDQMIDVGSNSYPVLADMNGDGLDDLLIGCWGRYDSSWYNQTILKSTYTAGITYYENRGTPLSPRFVWVTDDLGSLRQESLTGLYPATGDLNGDGFTDLLVGVEDGTLIFLENDGSSSSPPAFKAPVWQYQGIDVGKNSAPQLFDLDHDSYPDLIIGEQNGNLNLYRHNGDPVNPLFQFVTDSLGKINVTNYQLSYHGYSTPCFFTDHLGNDHLICGSEEGKIWYVEHIPDDPEARYITSEALWMHITDQPFPIRCGWRTAAAIGYLTAANRADLIIGNFSGGLNYFSHQSSPDVVPGIPNPSIPTLHTFSIHPNPASTVIRIDLPLSTPPEAPLRVTITTLTGRHLLTLPLPQHHTLPIDFLSPGIYLVSLSSATSEAIFQAGKLVVVP